MRAQLARMPLLFGEEPATRIAQPRRRTIGASSNPAVIGGMVARNNGRYNGDGRHWETPPEIFDPLHNEFGFTVDVCATTSSAKVPRFFAEPGPWAGAEWCAAINVYGAMASTADAVKALVPLLEHGDSSIRSTAAWALFSHRTIEVRAAMLARAQAEDVPLLKAYLEQLGEQE